MGITVGFRLSTYVTLMLACLCLALAEQPYVPGTAWFAGPVLALLVVAFFVDGRCALPVWTANVLGVFIVFGSAMWLISQLKF